MIFRGLIMIDAWGGRWHNHSVKLSSVYKHMRDFVIEEVGPLEHLVLATYPGIAFSDTDQRISQIPAKHTHTDIFDWPQFAQRGLDHGAWLIGGAAWQGCVHDRPLGIIAISRSCDSQKFQLYSHRNLVDTQYDDPVRVTNTDFYNDNQANWLALPRGFFQLMGLKISIPIV